VRQESKPWTRWWWLGSDVDKAGLTFNLESLARAGIGGVEITPIYGVQGRQDHYIRLSVAAMDGNAFSLYSWKHNV